MSLRHPRIDQLERVFTSIGLTRMHGVPVQNPALRVQCVGFEVVRAGADAVLEGILITPWFMNLVRLPLVSAPDASVVTVGTRQRHVFGTESFDFIAAHEPALGSFEVCSLFSPMFEFATHTAAVETAQAVLHTLRAAPNPVPKPVAETPVVHPKTTPAPVPQVVAGVASAEVANGRRNFLFGRARPSAAP